MTRNGFQDSSNWSRACWSNRRNKLIGSRKDWYSLQHHRLQLHVKNWYNTPRDETLIDRSKLLNDCEIILSRNNDAIAKWLDRRYEDREQMLETFKRKTGQMSMFSFLLPVKTRRQYNSAFQNRLQKVRRANLPTSSNMVDGDQSSEEPPD